MQQIFGLNFQKILLSLDHCDRLVEHLRNDDIAGIGSY